MVFRPLLRTKRAFSQKGPSEIFLKCNEITHIYINIDNQKKNGELLEVRVEFGSEQCVNKLIYCETYRQYEHIKPGISFH